MTPLTIVQDTDNNIADQVKVEIIRILCEEKFLLESMAMTLRSWTGGWSRAGDGVVLQILEHLVNLFNFCKNINYNFHWLLIKAQQVQIEERISEILDGVSNMRYGNNDQIMALSSTLLEIFDELGDDASEIDTINHFEFGMGGDQLTTNFQFSS